jgi:hypothetical protein
MSFWGEICVHSAFFMAFLALFYFTFVTYIQSAGLVNDLFNIVESQLLITATFTTPAKVQALSNSINSSLEEAAQEIPPVDSQNKKIAMYVGIVVGITSSLLLGLGIYLQYASGGSIYELLMSNLIVLVFIAVSEFAIVGLFLRNFVEIDQEFAVGITSVQLDAAGGGGVPDTCNFVNEFLETIFPASVVNAI